MPRSQHQANARAFLAAYRQTASITKAAAAAKVDRKVHYQWLAKWPGYKAAFQNAQEEAAQLLEDEAVRRATEGTLEPVFYQGIKCGAVRRYSDSLMQFLLRGFKPAKYSSKAEITGAGGGPIETAIRVRFIDPEPTED
ncbi:MAG: hypothetical protein V4502_03525 [Pseudomonadota bacterium]